MGIDLRAQLHQQLREFGLVVEILAGNLLGSHACKLFPRELIFLFTFQFGHDNLHDCGKGDTFFPDLDAKFVGAPPLLVGVQAEAAMLEHFLHVVLGVEAVEPYIVLGVLVDALDDCRVHDVADCLGLHFRQVLVVLYLLLLVYSQSEQSA